MGDELERFVRHHREDFDTDEPGKKVWENIRRQMEPPKKQRAIVLRLTRTTLSAAAAVLVLLVGITWWLGARHNDPSVATTSGTTGHTPASVVDTPITAQQPHAQSPVGVNSPATTSLAATQPNDPGSSDEEDATLHEEMYHYARLVELKQKELKHIEKDEPLLYQQFAADLHKLDSVYHTLQQQLTGTPDQEQVLAAMLQDLQLQMKLLNHQLDIVKQINHSKRSAYDSAYKTL